MQAAFLSIKEACDKTGRSESTIRRIIKSIVDEAKHPDRAVVEPSPAQVEAFKKKGDLFTWKIREDVLERELGGALIGEKKTTTRPSDIISILRKELEIKNEQIGKQWEVISALNERLREGNILMGSLQKRLALPEPTNDHQEILDAAVASSVQKVSAKSSKVSSRKPVKKGFFSLIFR